MIILKPVIIKRSRVCFKCRKVYRNFEKHCRNCERELVLIGENVPKQHLIGRWKKLCRNHIDRHYLWDFEIYYYGFIKEKGLSGFKRCRKAAKLLECDRYLLRRKYIHMLM